MNAISRTIKTDRLSLAALEWGNPEGTPVVALHGWLDNAASFSRLAESLDLSNTRLIAIDLPGHGLSEHRGEGQIYHLMEYVVDVVGVLKTLDVNPVVLLGHSLGGIVALLTAVAIPSKISQLILLDSFGPMVDKEDDVALQLKKAISKICLTESRPQKSYQSIDDAVDVRLGGFGKISREAARVLLERGLTRQSEGYTWSTDARLREPTLLRLSELQVQGFMKHIQCPTCLIAGTEGYISLEETKNPRLRYIAKLETHIVSGHHHFHMDGDVDLTAKIINRFLN
jgi:pimeloyl-ACP methyl ester carboxylesterase